MLLLFFLFSMVHLTRAPETGTAVTDQLNMYVYHNEVTVFYYFYKW